MSLKVEDAMVDEVITVDADATVRQAVDLMNKHEIGCLIVVRSGKAASWKRQPLLNRFRLG